MSVPTNAMMNMFQNPGMGGMGMGGGGLAVQPGTGMMAGGPTMQPAAGGGMPGMSPMGGMQNNPAQGGPQASAQPNGMSQAQKMMMAQALMSGGHQQGQSAPQPVPMNVGRNT